jgi:hypothetical protein
MDFYHEKVVGKGCQYHANVRIKQRLHEDEPESCCVQYFLSQHTKIEQLMTRAIYCDYDATHRKQQAIGSKNVFHL